MIVRIIHRVRSRFPASRLRLGRRIWVGELAIRDVLCRGRFWRMSGRTVRKGGRAKMTPSRNSCRCRSSRKRTTSSGSIDAGASAQAGCGANSSNNREIGFGRSSASTAGTSLALPCQSFGACSVELTFPDPVHELDAGDCDRRTPKLLEPEHRPPQPFAPEPAYPQPVPELRPLGDNSSPVLSSPCSARDAA
jgi:hypothetical protein